MKGNSQGRPETKCKEFKTQAVLIIHLSFSKRVACLIRRHQQAASTLVSEVKISIDLVTIKRASSISLTTPTLRVRALQLSKHMFLVKQALKTQKLKRLIKTKRK